MVLPLVCLLSEAACGIGIAAGIALAAVAHAVPVVWPALQFFAGTPGYIIGRRGRLLDLEADARTMGVKKG